MTKFQKLIGEDLNNELSKESLDFLKDWMWNRDNKLRKYQKEGLSAISDKVKTELGQFKPNQETEVFRAFHTLEKERKSRKNKLMSFSPFFSIPKNLSSDMNSYGYDGSYIFRLYVDPDAVLVDTSSFYNDYDEIIPEVIIITEHVNFK